MASKRASNSASVRRAFGRPPGDDDETRAGPASGCGLCTGHWLPNSTFEHDTACVLAGKAVMARREQQRRQNGLA